MKILFSELLEDVVAADAKICENAGIPDGKGTERWSEVSEFEEGYFIAYPESGWGGLTTEQMMDGVVGVVLRDITIISEELE